MSGRRLLTIGLTVAFVAIGGPALANGVAVLDELQEANGEVQSAVAEAQADYDGMASGKARDALAKLIKYGTKASGSLDRAIDSLLDHDLSAFRNDAEKAVKRLLKAETRMGPTYLASGCTEEVVAALRQAVVDSRSAVDPSDQENKDAKAEKQLLKGDDSSAGGNLKKAAYRYLKAIKAVRKLPVRVTGGHRPVVLRARNGAALNPGIAVVPYSPRRTCGACHDYEKITEGFHFDQGQSVMRDDFAQGTDLPDYVLSDGMFGRW